MTYVNIEVILNIETVIPLFSTLSKINCDVSTYNLQPLRSKKEIFRSNNKRFLTWIYFGLWATIAIYPLGCVMFDPKIFWCSFEAVGSLMQRQLKIVLRLKIIDEDHRKGRWLFSTSSHYVVLPLFHKKSVLKVVRVCQWCCSISCCWLNYEIRWLKIAVFTSVC